MTSGFTQLIPITYITCASLFVLIVPFRLWKLHKSGTRNPSRWLGCLNTALAISLSVVLSYYWVQISTFDLEHKPEILISILASIVVGLSLGLLLYKEHQQDYGPSVLVLVYLVAAIVCDAGYLKIIPEDESNGNVSHVIFTRCWMHTTLFITELCTSRCSNFDSEAQDQSPEECCGLISRTLFLWINPILLQGYKTILTHKHVPSLHQDMSPATTRQSILETWSQRVKPETKRTLPMALYQCLKRPFLAAVVPRLILLVFRYSQPILIKESIRYISSDFAGNSSGRGAVLIVSALSIYGGLALSTAIYRHRINQLKLMTNSALVGLIHDKTMKSPSITYSNGEATTLMSTDADSLDGIAEMVHETWAQVVEVLIGIGLLSSQVGWIWPLPLFLIYLCSHMSRFVAKHLQPRQKAWNAATQQRIGATSSLLSAMKGVKMLGIQHNLTDRIQWLREQELLAASKLRWVMVYYNASANALGIFSPAITVVIYALIAVARGGTLDTETAFTTMAILSMVTHPANMVMTIVPRAVAAFAGFERIQAFLLREDLPLNRAILAKETHDTSFGDRVPGEISEPADVIQICELRIGVEHPVLENITLDIAKGSFVIVSGPTGSGKTSLLRAMLGEIVPAHGSISVSTPKIAYCAQKPWLPNETIKKVIYGATAKTQESEKWYREVTEMCCLTHDFDPLADGDQTMCGSGGLNLSGGQRQRVALARALFAKCDLLLLDDTFSGLDGDTEQRVFENIFGPEAPVRRLKTTVVLVSNSAQYFRSADHIVVLGEQRIAGQGRWDNLKIKPASIEKFSGSQHAQKNAVLAANFEKLGAQLRAKDESEMDLARQTGDPALYAYYLRFIDAINIILLIATSASYSIFITIPQYWLRLWTESDGRNIAFYVYGFLFLSTMSWMSTSVMMGILVIRIAPQSGKRLHQRLLDIVANAPLSYLSQTDNGSILNRFSQDIQLIDKQLPTAFQTVMTQIFKLLMQITLLCIADKWLALSLPACGLLVYLVQKIYLRTSRQLRLLELESRAGVFSSFLESIDGLETIRAYGWTNAAIRDNIQHLDHAQRPEYLLLCLRRWLSLVLDLLAAALATIVVATAVAFRGQVSGAQVGIALNVMLVTNTTLLSLVVSWTNLETSLGAIARLKTLEEFTPTEGGTAGSLDPPRNWPSKGEIEFDNVTASYHAEANAFALRNLSLRVTAGQKLVICGRTGSGKSTVILTLLRLLELQAGTIKLDGLDIRQVRLDLLRQRGFIAVSQDALLFPNEMLRFNLDPDSTASDEVLALALGKAGLWRHFSAAETPVGEDTVATIIDIQGDSDEHPVLDRKVSSFPELSVGQCQLFAVCRALIKARVLRRCGVKAVVVLDEVTSSLDAETEATIHRIIDEEFTQEGHTVIVVAHRVGGLMDQLNPGRDAVAVMADGRLVDVVDEFDSAAVSQIRQVE